MPYVAFIKVGWYAVKLLLKLLFVILKGRDAVIGVWRVGTSVFKA